MRPLYCRGSNLPGLVHRFVLYIVEKEGVEELHGLNVLGGGAALGSVEGGTGLVSGQNRVFMRNHTDCRRPLSEPGDFGF